jgi:hypothetical protein
MTKKALANLIAPCTHTEAQTSKVHWEIIIRPPQGRRFRQGGMHTLTIHGDRQGITSLSKLRDKAHERYEANAGDLTVPCPVDCVCKEQVKATAEGREGASHAGE